MDQINLSLEDDDKIDLIISICHKLADILKDPTQSGQKELTAESRTHIREEAHEELLICIDVLASYAQFNHGFFDVINIANKHNIATKSNQTPE